MRIRPRSRRSREGWLQERRQGIGSSDAAILLGCAPPTWGSEYTLYMDKTGHAPASEEEDEPPELAMGRDMEPVIAARFARETGFELEDPGDFTIQRHPERPWQISTVDRFVHVPKYLADEWGGERGIAELKMSFFQSFAGQAPVHYRVQVQHQMAVNDLPFALIAALDNWQLRWVVERRRPNFIRDMTEVERAFWERIERREPPPVDGGPATTAFFKSIRPHPDPAVREQEIILPEEASSMARRLDALKADAARIQEEIGRVENWFKAQIGPYGGGRMPAGKAFYVNVKEGQPALKVPFNEAVIPVLDAAGIPYTVERREPYRWLKIKTDKESADNE